MLSLKSLLFLHRKPLSIFVSLKTQSHCVHAVQNDSQNNNFEIDPDEAKQALQKLDQQLKSLSNKQISSSKIRAADVKVTRGPTEQETQDISGSFLTSTAIGLLIFTMLYNVLFYAVIKPSIDRPDEVTPSDTAPASAYYSTN